MDTITIVMVAALILKERHGGVSTSLQDAYTRVRDVLISTADSADAAENVLASLEANPTSPARQLALDELLTSIPVDQRVTLRRLSSVLIEQVMVQRHGTRIIRQLDGTVQIHASLMVLRGASDVTKLSAQALARLYRSPLPDDDITASVERDSATSSPTMLRQQRIAKTVISLFRASLLGGGVVGLIVLWGLIITPPLSTHPAMGLVVLSLSLIILSGCLYAMAHIRQQQLEQAEHTFLQQVDHDITEILDTST